MQEQQQLSESLPQLDIRYILHVLWSGKWLILACMLLTMALAMVNNNFQKVSYRAQAQLQVDAPPFLPSPGADFTSQSSYYLNIDRYFKTEKQKLTSRRMHLLFAERLKQQNPRFQSQSNDAIAGELGGGISLAPVEDTNLLWLEFIADDPRKASDWVNLYVDLYVEENDRQQGEAVKQSRDVLKRQLYEIKSMLASQQTQMNQYAENSNVPVTPEMASVEFELLSRYRADYEDAKAKREEEEQKLSKLEGYIADSSKLTNIPELVSSPGFRSYYNQWVEANNALERLRLDGKGEEHPAVTAKRVELENLRKQLRNELVKYADGMRVSLSVLQNREQVSQKSYSQKMAERRVTSRHVAEMSSFMKSKENWASAFAAVEQKLRDLSLQEGFVNSNIKVVEHAGVGYRVATRGMNFVVLATVGGMILGMALVVLGEVINPRVKTVEEIQTSLSVPALGFLPRTKDFALHQIRESYNVLRTELLFNKNLRQHKVIMVTSSLPEEGKTTVTMNLAKTLAAAGDRTMVVDFDLRKARLRSILSTGKQNGNSVFSPVEGLKLRVEQTQLPCLHLTVADSLPQNPPYLLSQPSLRDFIAYLREHYDWVLIDTPPVTSVTDPVIMAALVDTILFVIKYNFVDKRIVRNSLSALAKTHANIMGAVLNDLDVKKTRYYAYQSYYRYYSDSDAK
jgi:polysaccharide biosynthesis transport protein